MSPWIYREGPSFYIPRRPFISWTPSWWIELDYLHDRVVELEQRVNELEKNQPEKKDQ